MTKCFLKLERCNTNFEGANNEIKMYPDIDEVKKILRSLLVATPRGMSVRDLDREFNEIEGRRIPYREFSFDSLNRFLYSMPGILRVSIRIGKNNLNIQVTVLITMLSLLSGPITI